MWCWHSMYGVLNSSINRMKKVDLWVLMLFFSVFWIIIATLICWPLGKTEQKKSTPKIFKNNRRHDWQYGRHSNLSPHLKSSELVHTEQLCRCREGQGNLFFRRFIAVFTRATKSSHTTTHSIYIRTVSSYSLNFRLNQQMAPQYLPISGKEENFK